MISDSAYSIFKRSIYDYHVLDSVYQPLKCPYTEGSLEFLLYKKNWIDTIQWHYEDIVRALDITPEAALDLKRKIDASNQQRTDLVEYIDSYFWHKYKNITPNANATINTESPAWAIDRLSILALKIFHMKEQTQRKSSSLQHLTKCKKKLDVLEEQKKDLSTAIDQLLSDIEKGNKYMKVYKQMKMYNDPTLNPVLYKGKKHEP